MMLALIDVLTDVGADDASGVVGVWWPVAAIVLPFLQALIVNDRTRKQVKHGIAVLFALAAVAVSVVGMDWSMITPDMVAARFVVLYGVGQGTYALVSARIAARGNGATTLNDVLVPDRGVTVGAAKDGATVGH